MKKAIAWIKDWYKFGKNTGLRFAFKYKTGRAVEGKDFF